MKLLIGISFLLITLSMGFNPAANAGGPESEFGGAFHGPITPPGPIL